MQRLDAIETLRNVDASQTLADTLPSAVLLVMSYHLILSVPQFLQAHEGIETLRKNVDTLIVIPNDRLLAVVAESTALQDAFLLADDVLRQVSSPDQQQSAEPGGSMHRALLLAANMLRKVDPLD